MTLAVPGEDVFSAPLNAARGANIPVRGRAAARRYGLHRPSVAVLVVGLVCVAALTWVTAAQNADNQARLLRVQTREAGAAIELAIPSVETPLLTMGTLASATSPTSPSVRAYVAGYLKSNVSTRGLAFWRTSKSAPSLVAAYGSLSRGEISTPTYRRFVAASAHRSGLSVLNLLSAPSPTIGLAYTIVERTGDLVVFAPDTVKTDRIVKTKSNAAFADLDFALYLGSSRNSANLLESTTPHLPLSSPTASTTFPFGNTSIVMITAATGNLPGPLSAALPWLIAILGSLLVIGAWQLTDQLVVRTRRTEVLADENQELYRGQRSIAESLQRALLPDAVPVVDKIRFGVRFIAGGDEADIGGDWFDVVALEDGAFFFVVGDVSGHGLSAARVMANLHFAIRAYALDGERPAEILAKVGRFVSLRRDRHFATVLCGLVDVQARTLTLANAGHLPPLVIVEGRAEYLETDVGTPVGVRSNSPYRERQFTLGAHAIVLAFTDGLVERRGESIDRGLDEVAEKAGARSGSLERLLTSLVTPADTSGIDDDIAILGFQWLE